MMIKRKFKEELNDLESIQNEHYKIMNSENRKKIFEKQNNNQIRIQLKTETKNESKININNIKTRRILGFSFRKPEPISDMDKFYFQNIKENRKID